jgi:hypothetical protein
MGMAVRQAIPTTPSRGFKPESATDDCCDQTRKPGEVLGEGQGRKAPREALQWRGDRGHAIMISKLLDHFQQPCVGSLRKIASRSEQAKQSGLAFLHETAKRNEQNSRAQVSHAKQ